MVIRPSGGHRRASRRLRDRADLPHHADRPVGLLAAHAAPRTAGGATGMRARRDDVRASPVKRVWNVNPQVYGARKVWRQFNHEGISVACCTVEWLMRPKACAA